MISSSDNISKQADEIEVLSSIYGEDWRIEDESTRKFTITVKESTESAKKDVKTLMLNITFPEGYPSEEPPLYELSAVWLRGEKRLLIDNALNEIYFENCGESIIYLWVEKLREFLNENTYSDESETSKTIDDVTWPPGSTLSPPLSGKGAEASVPEIYHGDVIEQKKSKFTVHLAKIYDSEQIDLVLDRLKENRKIAAATHNIYAYRIEQKKPGTNASIVLQGSEDDGETHAGQRMLHLMQIIDCMNVIVVVTRWYGGIHLGPDRFKHINNLTRAILEEHGFIRSGKKEQKKSKKK